MNKLKLTVCIIFNLLSIVCYTQDVELNIITAKNVSWEYNSQLKIYENIEQERTIVEVPGFNIKALSTDSDKGRFVKYEILYKYWNPISEEIRIRREVTYGTRNGIKFSLPSNVKYIEFYISSIILDEETQSKEIVCLPLFEYKWECKN